MWLEGKNFFEIKRFQSSNLEFGLHMSESKIFKMVKIVLQKSWKFTGPNWFVLAVGWQTYAKFVDCIFFWGMGVWLRYATIEFTRFTHCKLITCITHCELEQGRVRCHIVHMCCLL